MGGFISQSSMFIKLICPLKVGFWICCTMLMMRYLFAFLGILLFGLVAIFSITSPATANLAIFLLVFVMLYFFFLDILIIISWIFAEHKDYKKLLFVSVVLAFAPTFFIGLSTLSSINLMDIVLSFGIPLVVTWYGLRSSYFK